MYRQELRLPNGRTLVVEQDSWDGTISLLDRCASGRETLVPNLCPNGGVEIKRTGDVVRRLARPE
jgi:hypothetical protein